LIYPVIASCATVIAQWLALGNYCCHRTGAPAARPHQHGVENDEQAAKAPGRHERFSRSPIGDDFAGAMQLCLAAAVPPAVEMP